MGAFWTFDEKLEKWEGNLHKIVERKLFVYQTTQNYHHSTLTTSTKIMLFLEMPTFSQNAFLKEKSYVKENENILEYFVSQNEIFKINENEHLSIMFNACFYA